MEFKCNDFAAIVNTGSALDGAIVRVVGLALEFVTDHFYIVDLGEPNEQGWTHIVMTGACLKKV